MAPILHSPTSNRYHGITRLAHSLIVCLIFAPSLIPGRVHGQTKLEWIRCKQTTFVTADSIQVFRPHGFNYDHDAVGLLIEDYWHADWARVAEDFAEMKQLGANVVRVHLQFGKFMSSADKPIDKELRQFAKLLELAEQTGLYLDVTGLGCYHKPSVPIWYDELDEAARWEAQCRFWQAIAEVGRDSPAVFCWDLMNEPVVAGAPRTKAEWLGPPFAEKHFVQFISLDAAGRTRPEVALAWIEKLTAAIRAVDSRHLITVGLVDWSLERPGLTSGFVPEKVCRPLDFVSVHLYPEFGKLDAATETLKGFSIGKPLVLEETYPLGCSTEELIEFLGKNRNLLNGTISFYWGETLADLKQTPTLRTALMSKWLEQFKQ